MAESGARLTILNGPLAGRELALEASVDNVLIGSDGSCRFHIPTPGISPIHARIWLDAGGVTVYDTHSPRGLYINDDRVNGQAPLKNGDVLWLGTPGEDEAVMIQVRLPPRGGAASAPDAESTSDDGPEVVEETMVLASQPAPPPAEEADGFAVAKPDDADATVYEMSVEEVEPPAAPVEDADATLIEFGPRASEPIPPPDDADAFAVAEPEDTEATRIVSIAPAEPVRFAVNIPPPPPPEPPVFEDETTEMPAVALPEPEPEPEPVWTPPPPPPPPTPRPVAQPPVIAAPPPPRPTPTRPPVRPAPTPVPRPARARAPSATGRNAAIAAAGALVLIGAGLATWKLLAGAAPSGETVPPATAASAPPSTAVPAGVPPTQAAAPDPVPEPPVEEAVTIVNDVPPATLASAPATPRPTVPSPVSKAAAPPPPTTLSPEVARAQQVASLLGRAETAAASWDYAGASATFDEVLKLEPSNARATQGRAQAQAALASLRKGFVSGRTTVTGGKAAKGGLSGFDSEDVSVAKALDYSGRIEFEASPRSVKPGDTYNVQVYLTNDGKKGFKIGNVAVTTSVNGSRSGGPATVRERDVESGGRVLLTEVSGTWQASTTSWSLEVVVTSSRNDTFRSQLTWR